MKLYYAKGVNFGDVLNKWLWHKLIGNLLDDDDGTLFVGFGTILNTYRLGKFRDHRKLIFGAGCGYYPPIKLDSSFKIYCVRGPLTAGILELPPSTSVTDSALLINQIHLPTRNKIHKFGVMPHHNNLLREKVKESCNTLGFLYIDPNISRENSIDTVIGHITSCDTIITEALHGAIVADSIGVPWIPAMLNYQVLSFKWRDWALSLNLKNPFTKLDDLRGLAFSSVRKICKAIRSETAYLSLIPNPMVCNLLSRFSREEPMLSDRRIINEKTEILLHLLDQLERDLVK